MKKAIAGLMIFCLVVTAAIGQQTGRLKNAWTNTYLNVENGSLQSTSIKPDWLSAQWQLEPVQEGVYRIKNAWKGTYINIETGALQSGAIRPDMLSAQWLLKAIPGSNTVRIYSNWHTDLAINVEPGAPVCTPVQEGWISARWIWEPTNSTASNNTGENNPPATNPADNPGNSLVNIQEMLDAHNSQRSAVGVPPLTWSPSLAAKAQAWANHLAQKNRGDAWVLEHSGPGENLAGGFVTGDSPAKRILSGWGDEIKNFDRNTRKCIGGSICGHYTQVVWRNTTKVGCGVTANPNGKYILVCNYDPPGNFNDEPAF